MHLHSPSDYVAEIYQAMVTTSRQDLEQVANDLKEIVPGAMHTMLEKETKEEAIKKHHVPTSTLPVKHLWNSSSRSASRAMFAS